MKLDLFVLSILISLTLTTNGQTTSIKNTQRTTEKQVVEADASHDFDFEIGTWDTKLKRLTNPLSKSTPIWAEYEGTTLVTKVWDGKANLVQLIAEGKAGHFEALSLRLYNPAARQWTLNFSNAKSGMLSEPSVGEFKNGVGEFYSQEDVNGRMIFVKFIIQPLTTDSIRFEQFFSDDGAKSWELNWVAIDTRKK